MKKKDPLGRDLKDLKSANAFSQGKKRKRGKPVSKGRVVQAVQ